MNRGSKIFTFVSLLVILLVAISVVPLDGAVKAATFSVHIEEEVQRLVTEGDIPSLHTCIISSNENSWVKGFGEQTSQDTVFLIARAAPISRGRVRF